MNEKLLSIIVPAFNEEKTVGIILDKLINLHIVGWEKEIIVVNDGSTDGTEENVLLKKSYITYLKHHRTLGKGAALQTGVKFARGNYVLIQDADLEYDTRDIPSLLLKVDSESAVFGARSLKLKRRWYIIFAFGDRLLTLLVNIFFKSSLTSVFTCYKLIPIVIFKSLDIKSRGFAIEMEITLKLLEKKIKIYEIPIKYNPRTFKEGKKFTTAKAIRDTFLSLIWIVKIYTRIKMNNFARNFTK